MINKKFSGGNVILKKNIIACVLVSMVYMMEIVGCSYSRQGHNSEEMQAKETTVTDDKLSSVDTDFLNNTVIAKDNTKADALLTDESANNSSEVISDNTYEMKLYTKAPNQDSTIKIQYPVFYGSKADEINSLILAQVQDMAFLDLSRFPENPKKDANYQSAVTLQNSKIISVVFWGNTDIEVSQFPTTNLYALNIDLTSLKLITLKDLYTVNAEFEKVFFEKAFFPSNPVTSYNEDDFDEMLKIQTPEYKSIGPFSNPDSIRYFLKPDGIVLSMPAVHASGSDHFEAELLYSDIQEYYLPEQIYWE